MKQNNQGHESEMGTTRGKEKAEERGIRKSNRGVNMIKVYFIQAWKCHDEIPYYIQFNICQ
jgi:hypothetical protein